jgi:hypothetical protein
MGDMRKKKMPKVAERPVREGRNLNFWVSSRHARALDDYLASMRPAPTITSSMETALEEFLERRGFWPPKDGDDD